MDEECQSPASFAREFFKELSAQGTPSVVIHSYEAGLEDADSDIDFAVAKERFDDLPSVLLEFCHSRGWRLVQVIQHETSASYFVCCRRDDPGSWVALDACSDYRVRGRELIPASSLLEGRFPLDWGGWKPSPQMELRYLFLKGAAKQKDARLLHEKLSPLLSECGETLVKWLLEEHQIELVAGEVASFEAALAQLACQLRSRKWSIGEVGLKLGRVLRPCGLFHVTKEENVTECSQTLAPFFRQVTVGRRSALSSFAGLAGSELQLSSVDSAWSTMVRRSWGAYCRGEVMEALDFLEQRTRRRI